MKTIHLHGSLKKKFGEFFKFDVATPREAFAFLIRQVKGFKEALEAGRFVIICGSTKGGVSLAADELHFQFGNEKEMHVIPYIGGAGGHLKDIVKIVVGFAIIVVSGFFGFVPGMLFGAGLVFQGVAGFLTPRPDLNGNSYNQREAPDQRPSFLFTGPVNTSQQGLPVPLVYGRIRVGSQVISSGVQTEVLA